LSNPTLHERQYGLVLLGVWSRNSAAMRPGRERSLDVPVAHQYTNVCLQHSAQLR